ncbi:MAG: hypothetical protein BWY09_00120 [Candidatus Hydrogenedentes bacterium ADurb.Bin179]|nr:MAG: hypothetical protein BWY09_00120 [Candidatus Hydrogenedentes bacterium ADurb.Bin179]
MSGIGDLENPIVEDGFYPRMGGKDSRYRQ